MEFTLKKYPCAFCGGEETKPVLDKQGFTIVQCRNCRFVYVNPRVENSQLASIYRNNYFKNKDYGYIGYEQEKRLREKNFERWITDAGPFIASATTVCSLDVGCAAGYCLELMQKKGWKVKGLELDQEMCKDLRQAGFDISESTIEAFETTAKFSVITLFDVIEHIPGIDSTFKKLRSLLGDGGIIILVTPDYNSIQRKLMGKSWFQFKPIEHIQYFDLQSLKSFAERNGLEIIHKSKSGQYADTDFLINRLHYYHFHFWGKLLAKIFGSLKLKNKYFYTDTGSLYLILKSKKE